MGPVVVGHAKFFIGAEHAVGDLAPELALLNVNAPGQGAVVQGHGYQVPLGAVLSAGDDLNLLLLAHVHLADPHVVGVFVALDLRDAANHHVGDLLALYLGDLHLGAGEGHIFREIVVTGVYRDKFIQPSSRQ